jgi:NAD(P)-dependent dehydrogenase (short-subunit alcohol dehydrogenase family)
MVEQAGRRALVCTCDVSSVDAVKMLASDVTKHFGRCDMLINCAGIFPNQPFRIDYRFTGDSEERIVADFGEA